MASGSAWDGRPTVTRYKQVSSNLIGAAKKIVGL